MDFRSLLQSMTTLSEAEGTVHKGTYGTSHGKEDVRDQYGHRVGKVDKEAGAKKDAPKKGRGRPKKGADDSGEVKTYDTKTLGSVFGGGEKPKKEVGKVSKKHSLKEYIEEAEQAIQEGMASQAPVTIKPASQTNTQVIQQGNKTLGTVNNPQLAAQIKQSIGKGEMSLNPGEEQQMTEVSKDLATKTFAKRASNAWGLADMATSDDDYEDYAREHNKAEKTLGRIGKRWGKDAQTSANRAANKEIFGKEDMAEGKDEGKPGKNFAKIAKSAGEKYGSKAAGERVAGAVRAKLAKQGKLEEKKDLPGKQDKLDVAEPKGKLDAKDFAALRSKKKVDESISLAESPATLQHIINRFKNEVKRFINGDELDHDLYEALFDYYMDIGEIPYGTAKGRTGDPYEWITQRFDQDVHNHIVDENTIRDFTQHALKEPTSSFTEPGSPMAVPKGTPTKLNRPVQDPTPWKVDPINAATDRAINFISGLRKPKTFEGTDMKDIQLESWEKQLNNLLSEGITVSSSQGQQGSPDSVSITATDSDAQTLMGVLRNAGIGGFGAEEPAPEIGYGVAQGGEEEPTGTGTEPQAAPEVVGDGDDMLALIKKLTGMGGEAEVVAVGGDEEGQDYEDEEDSDTALQPADSGDDDGKEELTGSDDSDKEETTEGNFYAHNVLKAKEAGKSEADLDGDGDMEKVKEEEEDTCNECGMYESKCGCDHEQVEENYANDAGGDAMAETELAKLKALLSMGNDLHKMKRDQTVGNPTQVAVAEAINDWKKLSGIK